MQPDEKACPRCAETIKAAAQVCRHCGFDFTRDQAEKKRKEAAQKNAKGCGIIAGVIVLLGIIGSVFGGGNDKSAPAPTASASPTSSPSDAIATPDPVIPTHIWSEHRKGVYYYIGAVSEDDQKAGRAAGSAVGFRYHGQNRDGDYILEILSPVGGIKASCSDPCQVIHYGDDETIAFNPDSLIGEAFTDAMNGQLEKSKRD